MNKFKSDLKYSQLVRIIDAVDTSIISNDTTLKLSKRVIVNTGESSSYYIKFQQPITSIISNKAYGVTSSPFILNGQSVMLRDDGNGSIFAVLISSDNQSNLFRAGTVDYNTGEIVLSNLQIDSYSTRHFKIYAIPLNKDIMSIKDVILSIDLDDSQINVIEGRE